MNRLYDICLMLFLIIAGLGLAGAGLPRWVVIAGGIAGVVAGVILLIGVF